MKKILSLMLMLMAFTVSSLAQDKLYVAGGDKDWSFSDLTEMTYNETTEAFEYQFENTTKFYFAIADGAGSNWDDFNGNHRYAIGSGDQTATIGTPITLQKVNGTIVVEDAGKFLVSVTKALVMTITKLEEGTPEVPETYGIVGEITGGWENDVEMTQSATDANVYTLEVKDFTANAAGYSYKLRANKKWGLYELPAVGNAVWEPEVVGATYDLLFTANIADNALTLTATKTGDAPVQTFTATFVNGAKWEAVYAYTFEPALNGDWPGTALTKSDTKEINGETYDVYAYSIESTAAPKNIIFNNGGSGEGNQTENLVFENGKEYSYGVPEVVEVPEVFTIVGDFTGGWHDGDTGDDAVMTKQENGLYTYVIEKFEAEAKTYQYRLRANHKWGVFELPAVGNNTYEFGTEGKPAGYYKLTFTANVTEEAIDGVEAYTLTLDTEMLPTPVYTATFDNAGNWENVYAYTWTGEVKQLGEWPGTKLEAVDGVYTVTVENFTKPEHIIFNNGDGVQTADLAWVDGKAYTYTAPATNIEISPENNTDIIVALNAAKAAIPEGNRVGNITINLAEGGSYGISASIEAPANLVINGNGATIYAQDLADPFIALSATPTSELISEYYRTDLVKIENVTILDLKNSILYDNNTKYCVVDLTINNSVLRLATEAVQNEALISFQQGGAKDFTITNSTVYGNNAVAKYFIRYNNSARLDRYGFDKNTELQKWTYNNNTFYGLLKSDGQWGNGANGQSFFSYEVQKNIWYNCGTDIIRRLFNGRASTEHMTFGYNTYFNDGKDISTSEASYDKSETILTTDPKFKDAANGDFALEIDSDQAKNETGDRRWGTWVAPVEIEITSMEIRGEFPGMSWDEGIQMTQDAENSAVWTLKLTAVDIEGRGYSYKAFANGVTDSYQLPDVGNQDWIFGTDMYPAGKYDLTFTANTSTHVLTLDVVASTTDGIQSVSAAALENAVVYNMQGVRVAQPTKGLYIVNGRKVVLK